MSQENVEIVRRASEAFSSDGFEDALAFFTPDVAWYTSDRWPEGSR